jgi:UDP-N-acetyl-D-mannosaminuronic acid transferase (WecB/TagA/CpsF family)
MNLAFLGYYAKNKLFPAQSLYHWPDGIWLKKHLNINKIPGRDLFKSLKIPKHIDNINVLGNLSIKSKKFLKKKFKLKVFNQKLPFGNIKDIIKTKIELKKNSLILITLPTPKQEQLAYYISKKNSNYKIICIGASLRMASGEEKIVPNFMKNYEFLWRLKNDFFRRLKRLIESFFYYIVGKYIYKIYQNTKFIKID